MPLEVDLHWRTNCIANRTAVLAYNESDAGNGILYWRQVWNVVELAEVQSKIVAIAGQMESRCQADC